MVEIRRGIFKCPNGCIGTCFIRFAYDNDTEIEYIIMYCENCKKEFQLA